MPKSRNSNSKNTWGIVIFTLTLLFTALYFNLQNSDVYVHQQPTVVDTSKDDEGGDDDGPQQQQQQGTGGQDAQAMAASNDIWKMTSGRRIQSSPLTSRGWAKAEKQIHGLKTPSGGLPALSKIFFNSDKQHRCFALYKHARGHGYNLMAMHGPVLSIEQKVAMTFAPALKELHRRRVASLLKLKNAGSGFNVNTNTALRQDTKDTDREERQANIKRVKGGKRCSRTEWEMAPVVVDVGVNDGEDVPTWFEQFGSWHDSCTTYMLFEPQGIYWPVIANEVRKNYFLHPGIQDTGSAASKKKYNKLRKAGQFTEKVLNDEEKDLAENIETIVKRFNDESSTYFGPRDVDGRNMEDDDPYQEANQRRIVLLRAAVGPNDMHNKTVMLRGQGQGATIEEIDVDAKKKKAKEDAAAAAADAEPAAADDDPQQQETKPAKDANLDHESLSQIRLLSLQTVLNSFTTSNQHITFLKIDCEGADATILTNSEPLFAEQRVDFIIFELNRQVHRFPANYPKAVAMLRSHRYRCFIVGYNKQHTAFMLSEMDEFTMAQWRPKLETMICMPEGFVEGSNDPEDPLRNPIMKAATATQEPLVPGAVEIGKPARTEYLLRMVKLETKMRWARKANAAIVTKPGEHCFGAMFEVPCPICGNERQ